MPTAVVPISTLLLVPRYLVLSWCFHCMLDDITLLRQPQRLISDPPILEVLLAELGEWSAGGCACARPQHRRAHIRPQMIDICADDAEFKGSRNVIGEGS